MGMHVGNAMIFCQTACCFFDSGQAVFRVAVAASAICTAFSTAAAPYIETRTWHRVKRLAATRPR
jgi:hypothetical protein